MVVILWGSGEVDGYKGIRVSIGVYGRGADYGLSRVESNFVAFPVELEVGVEGLFEH